MLIKRMLSRRWLVTTILVILAMGVMVRLGIWQLQRLEQRRAFNERVLAQTSQPVLQLEGSALSLDLTGMEYREITAIGEYDHSQEIALRNQYWENEWGVHLVTPLKISGTSQYILVDRGWIPAEAFQSDDWSEYAETGIVQITGVIRSPRERADYGSRSDPTPYPGQDQLRAWNFVNISGLAQQLPYQILPVYIQQAPDPDWTGLPIRSEPDLELTEGPHMGYAIQWFIFATILGLGYPFFIRRIEIRAIGKADPNNISKTEALREQLHSR